MAMDVTAETLDSPITAQSIVKSAKTNLKVPEGIASEHILIGGDGTDATDEPTVVGKQFSLSNRVRGLQTDFTLFNEGFLKVRETKKKQRGKDYMLELCFLNPKPTVIKRFVTESFWAALAMGGGAIIAWLLTTFTSQTAIHFLHRSCSRPVHSSDCCSASTRAARKSCSAQPAATSRY